MIDLLATDSLIKATWCFLFSHGITLVHNVTLELPRENDVFIMETFYSLAIPRDDIKKCNHCRMFLRALYLSDITSGDGTQILEEAWQGEPYIPPYKSRSWPSYGKPPKTYWEIWRKWLKIAFLERGRRLKTTLQCWRTFDPDWPWYTDPEGRVLEYDEGLWYTYKPAILRRKLPTFESDRQLCQAPDTMQQASIYRHRLRIVCSGYAPICQSLEPSYPTFLDFLKADHSLHWCIHKIAIKDEEKLKEALRDRSAMAISDGSYKDSFGTASWTVGDPEIPDLISGLAVCPGNAKDMDSYRSELAGIYCIVAVMEKFCRYHNLLEGCIELGCDGLSALDSAFKKGYNIFHDIPSYDLVAAILALRRKTTLSWQHRHVKGHQDRESVLLDSWATRNITMDALAKQHLSIARTLPRHFSISGEPWQIWLGTKK
jgi:hypothetical protein